MNDKYTEDTEATYAFLRHCFNSMHDGRPEIEMRKSIFGTEDPDYQLNKTHVRRVVEQVWMWAGIPDPPRAATDNRIKKHSGKNYSDHGDHGENAVVVRSDTHVKTIYHECAHALLRQLGLNSGHSSSFRMLEQILLDTHLPGYDYKEIEARAIAQGLGITVDWEFDLESHVQDYLQSYG